MKKIGVFYGSSTGTTEGVAETIGKKLGVAAADIHDVAKLTADQVAACDLLVLGTSTWGDGELQDDWYDGVKVLKGCDLKGKEIALFGCGDSESYCDTFCDGIGVLYEELKDTGCTFVGNGVDPSDYNYSSSISVVDGKFVGLPLDEINEPDKTEERIDRWVKTLV